MTDKVPTPRPDAAPQEPISASLGPAVPAGSPVGAAPSVQSAGRPGIGQSCQFTDADCYKVPKCPPGICRHYEESKAAPSVQEEPAIHHSDTFADGRPCYRPKVQEELSREPSWIDRLGVQYGARQVAALQGNAARVADCNHWLSLIANEHWHEILAALRAIRADDVWNEERARLQYTVEELRAKIEEISRPAGSELDEARRFHELYEQLAPQFGYVTRKETRKFDSESPNGRTMIAVIAALRGREKT